MDPSYGDAQRFMSPSQWVRRMPPEDAVPTHIKITSLESQKSREAIPHRLDIRYGTKPRQLLDEFGCDLPEDSPIAVYVHGGYWQALSKTESAYVVGPLHKAGCRVFVVDYDLCPEVKLDDICEEMSEAAKYIVQFAGNHGVSRLWFLGHSAGGHLVTWIAINGTLEKAISQTKLLTPLHIGIIPLAGVFDLRPLVYTDENDALRLSKEEAVTWSPLLQTIPSQSDKPFTFSVVFVTCEHDSPELQRQSKLMYEKFKSWVPTAEFISVNKADHFSLVENLSNENYDLTKKVVRFICGKN